ncbi:hypothetical protein [Anaerocolumna jejuensis]|nr:hypothetical protein [Anaerocolumna jejuensis]
MSWKMCVHIGKTTKLDWLEIELDSKTGSKKRYIKITGPNKEVSYQKFEGLPEVTFTEKDIGSNVKVVRCILIPAAHGS